MSDPDGPPSGPPQPGPSSDRPHTLLLEMTTRALFPTVIVFSLYLLLVGHYGPGGGFSAGLVAGLAFVLRHITTGGEELAGTVRFRPPVLMGSGLALALVVGLVPTAFGLPALSSVKWALDVPLLGTITVQSSLFLDLGVYILIIGVVLDLLRSLGTGIERDIREEGDA